VAMTDRFTSGIFSRQRHNLHGQDPNFSWLQVEAAGAHSARPDTARTVCDDGFPGSFRGTYTASRDWELDFRPSAWRLRARQMELGGVRGAASDDGKERHPLCHQMVEARYDVARRDI